MAKERKQKEPLKKSRAIIRYVLCCILSAVMIIATIMTSKYADLISNVLNTPTTKVINAVEDVYKSDYKDYDALVEHEEEICKQVEEEGIVLLKNEENTLPFSDDIKNISVFGQDSVDFVYGGSGSGSVSSDKAVDLKTALEAAGYSVNTTLWDFYKTGKGSSFRKTYPSETGVGEFAVNEVPSSEYTSDIFDSFGNYQDAAIVVFGRSGGESSDLPNKKLDTGYMYLEIDDNERAMLQMACDNFDKVIVVINSSNAMELDFLEEYDVDACIWVGAVGQTGMYAIGEVLNGTVNPSGRLVDTYAYDSTSAPSFENLGNYTITNANADVDRSDGYLVYGENIYVGYRYYETRYEDVVMGTENVGEYDYSKAVQYPFGYGMSYTSFSYSDYSVTENEDSLTVNVTVTNTGNVAGKDVVQIYMQSPYTKYDIENGIEKASIELVGFAKTQILAAGESETVTVDVDKENMKTYDADGAGTYILDAGDYYFALGTNAHDALNNVLAAKGYTSANGMTGDGNADMTFKYQVAAIDSMTYSVSQETGNPIANQFADVDIRYYDAEYKYLSRNDWEGTWPTTYAGGSWKAPEDAISDWEFYRADEVTNDGSEMPTFDTSGSDIVYVSELTGLPYDDPAYETLLDEMSAKDITRLVRMGGYATISIDKIGLPATSDKDGPSGFSSSIVPGRSGMAYPAEVVMASTWNTELIHEVGVCIGEDSLSLGITGWYGPAEDIHRSPYSGRNFEYYSEDGYLSGMLCAKEIDGARSKGCIAYMKHFALNDQETNRTGGAVFANEQAIREIFLKGFELTVRNSDVNAAMASMNRIGARWVGGHYGLMTATLREEWGFEGMVITDQASVPAMLYQDIIEGLYAGTDLWLNTNASLWSLDEYQNNATVMNNARRAAHNIIYAVANSNAINGISPDSKVVAIIPIWQKALFALDAVVWIISLLMIAFTTRELLKNKKSVIEVQE